MHLVLFSLLYVHYIEFNSTMIYKSMHTLHIPYIKEINKRYLTQEWP